MLWKRVGSILRFCYNDNETLGLDSTCFATGQNIYGHENEMYNVGVNLKEVECL